MNGTRIGRYSQVRLLVVVVLILVTCLYFLSYTDRIFTSKLYAFQHTYSEYSVDGDQYRVIVIADMDTDSKVGDPPSTWKSVYKIGNLKRDSQTDNYTIVWKEEREVTGKFNEALRGMELSELAFFNKNLLTCDDRSGIVFSLDLEKNALYPLHIFSGDNDRQKGFKCEWMTVKGSTLFVGSIGKEWTKLNGEYLNDDPMWVKIIDTNGLITSVDWAQNFQKLNEAIGIKSPADGYMVHEAVNWDPVSKKWIFLPRRVSIGESYHADTESRKGSNLGFKASEDFRDIETFKIGELNPSHGFSSFKFIPFRHDEIVALKTVETGDLVQTYIMVYNLAKNEVLMPETLIGSKKFEGIEFI